MPSLNAIWLALPLLLALVMLNLAQVPPNDFWWHLRTGQIIVTTGAIPAADLFSFTRQGQPWVNQSWLMEAAFYLLYRAGGLPLIILGHAVTITAGYAMVQRACLMAVRTAKDDLEGTLESSPATGQGSLLTPALKGLAEKTKPDESGCTIDSRELPDHFVKLHTRRPTPGRAARIAAAGTLAAVFLGVANWTVRPQSASFALFGAVVFIVERDRRRATRWLWALPPLFALWANLHGGFVFGLGLLGIYAACRAAEALVERARHPDLQARAGGTPRINGMPVAAARRVLLATLLSALATGANPSGPIGTVRYVLGFLRSSATQTLNAEFQALSARSPDGAMFIGFVAVFLFVLYVRRVRPDGYTLASLLVFGAASLYTLRALPWFGMTAGPAAAWALTARMPSLERDAPTKTVKKRRMPVANGALATLLLACFIATLPWLRPDLSLPTGRQGYTAPHSTPIEAAKRLCEMPGRMATFTEIGFASYLAWACPSARVMIDTRFELYPLELWHDYLRVSAAQFGWQETLDRDGAALVLAGKVEQPDLVTALKASTEWRVAYEDDDALLAERLDPL